MSTRRLYTHYNLGNLLDRRFNHRLVSHNKLNYGGKGKFFPIIVVVQLELTLQPHVLDNNMNIQTVCRFSCIIQL